MMSKISACNPFWVTNISNRNVSLTDLGISIPARKSVNLLDKRHYNFDRIQLEQSQASGSLFNKKEKVVVRKVPPVIENKELIQIEYNSTVPSRRRSIVQIEEVYHEELELSDEAFAQQMSDLTDENYPKT